MPRDFTTTEARLGRVPLWLGLFGPSGSGKTFSALRLATGIRDVVGGEIYVVDSESSRSRHYADRFRFRHLDFASPFGSLDYLAAIRHCHSAGASVIIVDSASHEHEGEGGYLQTQELELARLSKGDPGREDRVRMLSWAVPAKLRQQFVNGLLQLNTNLIFCFRAKEKVKPQAGKMIEQGWQPIAGPSLLFEMTVNMLLLPGANGVPTWKSDNDAERAMMKLPVQFRELFKTPRALDEDIGQALANWAKGNAAPASGKPKEQSPDDILAVAATNGTAALRRAWSALGPDLQHDLKDRLPHHKAVAAKFDNILAAGA